MLHVVGLFIGLQYFCLRPACLRLTNLVQFSWQLVSHHQLACLVLAFSNLSRRFSIILTGVICLSHAAEEIYQFLWGAGKGSGDFCWPGGFLLRVKAQLALHRLAPGLGPLEHLNLDPESSLLYCEPLGFFKQKVPPVQEILELRGDPLWGLILRGVNPDIV